MGKSKKDLLEFIRRLPDDVTTYDVLAELCFKQQVEAGLRDVEEGRVLTHAQLKKRVARWRKSAGR